MNLNDLHIDNTWTLFLDRDGVINKKIDGDYVRNLKMFEWIDGSKEAIVLLSKIFREIIVVTNQQGVGKNLMNLDDLEKIHSFMISEIETEGGRIDAVYFSPNLANENNPMRKPGVGMLLKAKEEFPAIDFKKSIMVGDSVSDMEMADKLQLQKIWIGENKKLYIGSSFNYSDLLKFAETLDRNH